MLTSTNFHYPEPCACHFVLHDRCLSHPRTPTTHRPKNSPPRPPPPRGGSGSISEVAWNQNIFFKQNIENNQWNQFFFTENIWNSEVGSGADCWLANLQSCPFQRRWLENDSGALPLAQGLAKEMAFAGWQVMQWFRFCNLLRSFFYMTGLVCRGHSFWHDCLAEEKGNENLAGLELPFFF